MAFSLAVFCSLSLMHGAMCRNNLRQLDEITAGLQRRLMVGQTAIEDSSENMVPLSTSSAFLTAGTTLSGSTWEPQSTLHSSGRLASDTVASTEATAGDAVTELMRRTLESTSSHIQDLSRTPPDVQDHASDNDDDDNDDLHVGNSPRDGSVGSTLVHDAIPEEQKFETQVSADLDRYSDTLKSAQVLLKQLNEMTRAGGGSSPSAVPRVGDSPTTGDFDEDINHEDDDTLASIWALRQSARRDDSDRESLDSAVPHEERESSHVAPQALNDVELILDDLSASRQTVDDHGGCGNAGNLSDRMPLGFSGESSDTWFIDTQDRRAVDNMTATEVHQWLQENIDSEPLDADEAAVATEDAPREVCSPGRPLSQSSPSNLAQFSPASSMARKSRSLKQSAVQKHEQRQYTGNSSDSESDAVASMLFLHRRHPRTTQHAPRDRSSTGNEDSQTLLNNESSAVVNQEAEDVVAHSNETATVANQECEDNIEDEPLQNGDGSEFVTAQSPSQGSPARSGASTVSEYQAPNGHHSTSDEDSYPSLNNNE